MGLTLERLIVWKVGNRGITDDLHYLLHYIGWQFICGKVITGREKIIFINGVWHNRRQPYSILFSFQINSL